DVACLMINLHNRHDDTLFKRLCHTARTHGYFTRDGCSLLKFGMIIIEYKRIFSYEGVLKNLLMHIVPYLRFFRQPSHHTIVLKITIHLNMWCFLHIEIKFLITHFILPEILSRSNMGYNPQ